MYSPSGRASSIDDSTYFENLRNKRDNVAKTSLEAFATTIDYSTEFDREPEIVIEDEDDVHPPIPVPHQETNDKWMARIDAEWEERSA